MMAVFCCFWLVPRQCCLPRWFYWLVSWCGSTIILGILQALVDQTGIGKRAGIQMRHRHAWLFREIGRASLDAWIYLVRFCLWSWSKIEEGLFLSAFLYVDWHQRNFWRRPCCCLTLWVATLPSGWGRQVCLPCGQEFYCHSCIQGLRVVLGSWWSQLPSRRRSPSMRNRKQMTLAITFVWIGGWILLFWLVSIHPYWSAAMQKARQAWSFDDCYPKFVVSIAHLGLASHSKRCNARSKSMDLRSNPANWNCSTAYSPYLTYPATPFAL
jgi:hypothetical protein